YHSLSVQVYLCQRDHQTRPRLLNLAPLRRIEPDEINIESLYDVHSHHHSSASQSDSTLSGSRSWSSPCSAIEASACSHPPRDWATAWMTILSSSTPSSTSPVMPLCSSSGFGMRIPWELPIRMIRVLTAITVLLTRTHKVSTALYAVNPERIPR